MSIPGPFTRVTAARPPGPEMACRTCGAVLNTFTSTDHPTQVQHVHPDRPEPWDHSPQPIPADQLAFLDRRCDFCGDEFPLLRYATSDRIRLLAVSGADRLTNDYGDTWAACASCARLVEAGDPDPLWRHAIRRIGWSPRDAHARSARDLHSSVLASILPGRVLITSTRWPHSPPHPRGLPKIRERLAQLLRGDDRLPAVADPATLRADLAEGIDQSRLYWIDPEFTDLTHHATPSLPATTLTQSDVPVPHGLLLWDHPVGPHALTAASWTTTDTGNRHLTAYRGFGAGLPDAVLPDLRAGLGWLLPVAHTRLAPGDPIGGDQICAPLVVTWLLIAQRLAEISTPVLRPAEQRAYARTGRPVPDVRLVHLRPRPQRRPTTRRSSSSPVSRPAPETRDWITGFWREQPYGPKHSLRRPRYVTAYLRGPRDAPINASTAVRVLAVPTPPKR